MPSGPISTATATWPWPSPAAPKCPATWNRWSLLEGGSWVGPDTTGYLNHFGGDCTESHAWCSESGFADRSLTLLPEQVNEWEACDFMVGCGTGNWVFTLKIGARRLSTCGF